MKKLIVIFTVVCFSSAAFSQQQTDLNNFNRQRNKITRNGMIALGGWSAANLIYSGIATGQTHGTTLYFHQMNVMWGGINLGFAALGYLSLKNKDGLTLVQSLKQQIGIEKTYLLNIGLDAAYVATGLYLKERARSRANPQKLKGWGESIMLQGAALFLLDATMFALHNIHSKKLYKLMDKTQLGITGNGLGLVVKL